MTHGAYTDQDFADFQWAGPFRAPILPRALLCAGALVASGSLGLLALHAIPGRLANQPAPAERVATGSIPSLPAPVATIDAAPSVERSRAARLMMPAPARFAALRGPSYLSPTFTSGAPPVAFAQSAALRSWFAPRKTLQTAALETADVDARSASPATTSDQAIEMASAEVSPTVTTSAATQPGASPATADAEPTVVPPLPPAPPLLRDIPMPAPRPAFLQAPEAPATSGRRSTPPQVASLPAPEAPAAAPAQPSFFDRLFHPQEGPALAYAAPDDAGLTRGAPDRYTAVYNIATHTVTLPDGTRLEAHSGIGPNKDNPRSVAEHMRGATPPAIYDLTSREALFHGVAALRLNPVGDVPPYGRMGLLAHTYMLGPHGDSNGCVVFRDYAAFRRAYDTGQIRRLVVVAGA